ncbi:MAG: trypsin-like peptidase domain-containing protein [Deltaproteobacteria bacterium]|nr:trypsin-like peptidase domain-containing protein [Deltaproteobacteria bacterium]MBN2670191.1 trypsin-like peptidase domain-containing protein [Deltaproteobacteria bacterium]
MDIKFTFLNGERENKSVAFDRQLIVNMGSRKDNDFVLNLPDDTAVAGYHTQIRQVKDKIFIQDMGSAQGTFLNGQKISKTQLSTGDEVQLGIGGPRFQVTCDVSAPRLSLFASKETHKLYGQRTVGMMIQQALKSAGSGMSRSTSYFEALLENKLRITARRYRIMLLLIFALLLVMGIVLGVYIYQSSTTPGVKLISNESDAAESIAKYNKYNIFLLAGLPVESKPDDNAYQGFCTAFAIGPNLLATNAHCVRKATREYSTVWALMNEAPKNRYQIKKMYAHPDYTPESITPDVGILEINGSLETYVKMAGKEQLRELEPGSFVYLFGFPGKLNNLAQPVATFVRGEIGRVTALDHSISSFDKNTLLQHSAAISEGTSGSPMFNLDGYVVGINAGGYADNGKMMPGYNFGIRVDLVAPLLQIVDNER